MMRKVSAFIRNGCPLCSGLPVRFKSECLSALNRNACPLSPGLTVRFTPECLSVLKRNLQYLFFSRNLT